MQKFLLLIVLVVVFIQNGGGRLPDHVHVAENIKILAMADK